MANEIEIKGVGTIEEIKAAYYNANALRQPNYRLCQINAGGMRYYYNLNESGCEFYPSVTTIIRKCAPENFILTEWKLTLGKEAAEAYTLERANYGSMVHGFLEELIVTRSFPLDEMRERIKHYAEIHSLPPSFVDVHEQEAKEDMLAFAKWMKDYDVRPLAVECAIYHPTLKYAGLIDIVADLRKYPIGDKHGDERVRAIVDAKTTRKDFHAEHIWQLEMYRLAWNELFPDLEINEIANIRPKAWSSTAKKAISYGFEWQTDSTEVAKVPYIIELFKLEESESRKVALIGGTINLDNDIEDNLNVMTLEEVVVERSKELTAHDDDDDEDNLFPNE